MRAVTIRELRDGVLAFDFVDFLRLDEAKVSSSTWVCKNVECNGERAADLQRVSETGAPVSSTELLRLASGIFQVIDGDFVATS